MMKALVVIIFCIVVSVVVAKSIGPPAPETPCMTDWTQCTDNMDVANHYKEMSHIRFECKWESNKKVKYGEAKWPWGYSFGSLFVGDSAPKTGLITLVEPDVQMQNKYGAMVHTEVECTYNLKDKKVLSVWWIGEKK
jgi:hypothetical protein